MPDQGLQERHLELLRAIDAAGVATMYRACEGVDLDAVCKEADRQEFVRLVRDLKEAGYVEVHGITYMGLRASYSVTEEGHRSLEES